MTFHVKLVQIEVDSVAKGRLISSLASCNVSFIAFHQVRLQASCFLQVHSAIITECNNSKLK